MNRQQPMRQYANRSQSGTISQTGMGKSPIDNVVDRVMMIAQRVVAAEQLIKNQSAEIVQLKETINKLSEQVEEYTAPSIVKEARAPKTRSARRRKPSAALEKEVAKLTETTEN